MLAEQNLAGGDKVLHMVSLSSQHPNFVWRIPACAGCPSILPLAPTAAFPGLATLDPDPPLSTNNCLFTCAFPTLDSIPADIP